MNQLITWAICIDAVASKNAGHCMSLSNMSNFYDVKKRGGKTCMTSKKEKEIFMMQKKTCTMSKKNKIKNLYDIKKLKTKINFYDVKKEKKQ